MTQQSTGSDPDLQTTAPPLDDAAPAEPQGPEAILLQVGQALRRGREAQGLSTAELAQQLYMRAEQIEALEAADRSHLPEMVYVIAQTRRIAKSLGLDANALIEPLLDIRPGGQVAVAVPPAPAAGPLPATAQAPQPVRRPVAIGGAAPRSDRGPSRTPLAIGALLVALAGALLVLQPWKSGPQTATPAGGTATPSTGTDQAAAGGTPNGSLRLTAREPTWLEVKDGEGRSLYRGLFRGSSRFSLGQGLEILAGRPDLLLVERPGASAEPLGAIDQLRWYRIASNGQPIEPR
ncbi:MAG: helix-turn-helix domain-containing protein [Prochlorococcaceae cyanobacterium]